MMRLTFALLALLAAASVMAQPVAKTVFLIDQQGAETPIATVKMESMTDDAFSAEVVLHEQPFSDHFLSMRPFKCVTSADGNQLCYLPYPYDIKRQISDADLTDLEYQLLFIRRSATDYGINPWFGIYFQLSADNDTLSTITGTLHEVNLDLLASPPDAGNLRPLPDDEIHEADPGQHPWPRLVIR